jgi:uncharacterized ion transporter superfamily protein YfcC
LAAAWSLASDAVVRWLRHLGLELGSKLRLVAVVVGRCCSVYFVVVWCRGLG